MYKYNEITALSLEVSSRCQAKCPMCARNYHGAMPNPLLPESDIDYLLFKRICPDSFIAQLRNITLCGNFGDPIMNNDLISIIKHITRVNPNIRIEIDTNGSARSENWWQELARALPKNHIVQFGIDGLNDTHHIYRVDTKFYKIIANARAFMSAGGRARWNFITFKHNEHQLEAAEQMARELGFESFYEKQTSRFIGKKEFDVYDRNHNLLYKLEPPTEQKVLFIKKETLDNYRQVLASAEISCEVERTYTIHIDAQGHLWPCSFTAAMPYIYSTTEELVYNYVVDARENFNNFLNTKFGGQQQLDLRNRSIEEIVNSEPWQTAWDQAFANNSVHVCTRTCGKFKDYDVSQCRDQFLDLKEL